MSRAVGKKYQPIRSCSASVRGREEWNAGATDVVSRSGTVVNSSRLGLGIFGCLQQPGIPFRFSKTYPTPKNVSS
jgi:hypothetical protein